MRVLITGGAGFIGSHLCDELGRRPYGQVFVADKNGEGEDLIVDLLEDGAAEEVIRAVDPDVVVHLAAQVGRLFGEEDIRHTIASNTLMTTLVAKATAAVDGWLVYASTSEVYGDNGAAMCEEYDGPFRLPHNLYGLSKKWGEDAALLYSASMPTLVRFSMPYGTGVRPGRGRAALPNILWQAHTRQPIPIHRGAERSWCWIGDTVRAVRMILEANLRGPINVGRDDDPQPLRRLAERACEMTNAPFSLIRDMKPPPAQTIVKRLSTERLREELGWEPTVEIGEGMERVLRWVRNFDRDGNWLEEGAVEAA